MTAFVGKRDVNSQTLIPTRQSGDLGALTVPDVVEKLRRSIKSRSARDHLPEGGRVIGLGLATVALMR